MSAVRQCRDVEQDLEMMQHYRSASHREQINCRDNMKKTIIEYMKTAEPEEACGFLLENGKFVPIENIAEDKANSFEIDPLDWMELDRSEEHTSELQSRFDLVCRLLL